MRVTRILPTALACFLVLTGTALADYQPSQDQTIAIRILPNVIEPSSGTGALTFAAQEGVHQTVTSGTGVSVPHYYYWVTVNGQPIVAVDPLCSYEFRR